MSVANILKTDQKHLAAALLNMKNASLFIVSYTSPDMHMVISLTCHL